MDSRRITRSERDRDVRMHDAQPHINGNSTPASAILSPTVATNGVSQPSIIQKLNRANEETWMLIGRVAEQMGDLEHALQAYESVLRHNPLSLAGLTQVAGIARIKENYPKAVEYFQRVLSLQEDNGEIWSALGHCYLMQDDLQKAYSAYQQALYLLPNPKEDPKLWYGIGILYDRYGSLDHAEEAFSSVLRMDKDLDFDKANEILFRLGIIYKQQAKYTESLECFDRILRNPPSPLAHADIWFQIGHVYEQQKDHLRAKDAYERVVADNPAHAKVLQQLGWLYHQDGSSFQNQELAIQYLTKSLEADSSDAQSWYLLGRAYMAGQKYNKAYEAYQQAVYRDGRNPTFWCSIGVLYFQISQYRDALDAYSRAIRINPYISEVWFDLGSLYESCNNQISDAIDAYARASELDPTNTLITQRLQLLKNAQATGGQLPAAPGPQDVHPTAYASAVVAPPGLNGPPLLLSSGAQRPSFRADSRGPGSNEISLPPPSEVTNGRSTPPFRGGPPPPVILDETRHSVHPQLAPMDVDRTRDFPGPRENGSARMAHRSLLLHPQPQPVILSAPSDDVVLVAARTSGIPNHPDTSTSSFFTRPNPNRPPSSRSESPATSRGHERSHSRSRSARSPPPSAFPAYPPPPSANGRPQSTMGPGQPSSRSPRMYHSQTRGGPPSPTEPSPRSAHPGSAPSRYWEGKPSGPPPPMGPGGPGVMPGPGPGPRRSPPLGSEMERRRHYDPRYDVRDSYEQQARQQQQQPPPSRKPKRPRKSSGSEHTPRGWGGKTSPEPLSSGGSSRSVQPSPTSASARPPSRPSRMVDEDYDEPGVADALIGLATSTYRPPGMGTSGPGMHSEAHSPTISSGSRHSAPSPRPLPSHRDSISSTRSHPSPPPPNSSGGSSLKRALSPGPDEMSDSKRTKVEGSASSTGTHSRRPSSAAGHVPSSRPSPIPFRTQPPSEYPSASPPHLPLPPHPRPIGTGLANSGAGGGGNGTGNGNGVNLPPIATLSPPRDSRSSPPMQDERMQVDARPPSVVNGKRSTSPLSSASSKGKLSEMMNPSPPKSPVVLEKKGIMDVS